MPLIKLNGEYVRCAHFDGATVIQRRAIGIERDRFETEFIPGKEFPAHPPPGGAGCWSKESADDDFNFLVKPLARLPYDWRNI
jgi:hypothetical protein